MWNIRNIEFRPIEMDFRSSGQGRYSTTAIYADGEELVNALTLLDFTRGAIQLCVCGHCGSPGCKSGDYVSVRQFGDGLVLIPSFEIAKARGPRDPDASLSDGSQFAPPLWMKVKGPAFLAGRALQDLSLHVPALCEVDWWPLLTAHEFTRIMQWTAPARLFGEFPFPPRVRDELVVVVEPGEKDELIPILDALLARAFASEEPVTLCHGEPVTFYLDQPGIVEYAPLAMHDGKPHLANGPERVVSFPQNG